MAAIDKTYIDGKEYPLYRQWWIDNYDKMVKELGEPIWLYTFSSFYEECDFDITPEFLKEHTKDLEDYKNAYDFAIWNTSDKQDMWLVKNCPFESFRNRMLAVHNHGWKGFKGQKWVPKKNNKPKYVR